MIRCSSTSFGREESFSSWGTSTSSGSDGLLDDEGDDKENCRPLILRCFSLSSDEKVMRRQSSFISNSSTTDFMDCQDDNVKENNRLEDIIQCSQSDKSQKLFLFSASFPYHIEWANSEWSKVSGWSSDEIIGLDCKFLYGDATDKTEVINFWKNLTDTDGYASIDVLNYKKNHTLHYNSLHCFPVNDNCGPGDVPQISHIAVVITESYEIHHSADCAELIEEKELDEVGLPLDRREECNVYPHQNALSPPPLSIWLSFTDCLPLALMLRYMLRSQAPIVLTDREERIVHVNVAWVQLTGYSAVDCEGQTLSSFFNTCKDMYSLAGSNQFQRLIKLLQEDIDPIQQPSDCETYPGSPPAPPTIKAHIRDCHAPHSYEVANVCISKKSLFSLSSTPLSDPNIEAKNDNKLASSPIGISDFPSSPFGSPQSALRKSPSSMDSMDISSHSSRVPSACIQGISMQVSPVPIGRKHFAMLFIPDGMK